MRITTPQLPSGKYEISCTLNGKVERTDFFVYSISSTNIDSLTPNRTPIKSPVNLTLTGQGFVDTGKYLDIEN